jgi:diguanylate cyclase (GGDEF)-like protein
MRPPPADEETDRVPVAKGDSFSLLLVEDNPHDAFLLQETIRDVPTDWRVVYEETVRAGLRRAAGEAFDVVLLDLSLPDGDGVENVRAFRREHPRLPVVVLTGLDDDRVALEAVGLGAQDYLIKGAFGAPLLDRALRYAMERSRAVAQLQASEERYALVLQASTDGIWDWSLDNGSIYFSRRWFEMLDVELPAGDAGRTGTTQDWFPRVHPADAPRVRAALEAVSAAATDTIELEYRIARESGYYLWVLCRGLALRGRDGELYRVVGSQTDVTAQRLRDPLTDLPSRSLLMDRLGRSVQRARSEPGYRFAVAALNLDRFRKINDEAGHEEGDALLNAVAALIKQSLRDRDSLTRSGGDDFLILLDDIERDDVPLRVAARVQEALAAGVEVLGQPRPLSASIGFALGVKDYVLAEDIVHDAERAMRAAKDAGPGSVRAHDPDAQQSSFEALQLETALRHAVDEDKLDVHYQPIVEIASGRVRQVEALSRWTLQRAGNIEPRRFIPIAESSGVVVTLGENVLAKAAAQVVRWRNDHPDGKKLELTVNVAAEQLRRPDFPRRLGEVLGDTGLPGDALWLDIVEPALAHDPVGIAPTLDEIRALGVRIALDDFGTGPAGLTLLRTLPIDAVKLDGTLVELLERPADDPEHAFVSAVVGLARSLQLTTVAEQVQTSAQQSAVAALGVDLAQGWAYARAGDASTVDELLALGGVRTLS